MPSTTPRHHRLPTDHRCERTAEGWRLSWVKDGERHERTEPDAFKARRFCYTKGLVFVDPGEACV